MLVEEKYKRPCFAACQKCGMHGVIVYEDGSQSGPIQSIENGKQIIDKNVSAGKLSKSDAEQIEDHLLCSDLASTQAEIFSEILLFLLFNALKKNPHGDCPHPEWN